MSFNDFVFIWLRNFNQLHAEYMPCPERDKYIYIQEKEVKTVKTFKYLGSMFDANGGAETDVNNNRVKI